MKNINLFCMLAGNILLLWYCVGHGFPMMIIAALLLLDIGFLITAISACIKTYHKKELPMDIAKFLYGNRQN